MTQHKSLHESRTLWANAIGLAALCLSAVGFDTTGLDTGELADSLLQVAAGASFIASSIFRVLASRTLT
jgi:hypothetical protein